MSPRHYALTICFAASAMLAGTNTTTPPHGHVITWAREAQPLPYAVTTDAGLRNAHVPSPNGKYEIACNSAPQERVLNASVSEKIDVPSCEFVGRGKPVPIPIEVGPEALWAPDSDAVAITQSRGGALGTYQVRIYRADDQRAMDISGDARRDLARRYPACVSAGCTAAQRKQMQRDVNWVNVAAIRWMEKSKRILLMAWVPDSSDFGANLGRHQGYVVDARTGKILSKYSQEEFTRKFKKYCGDWGL